MPRFTKEFIYRDPLVTVTYPAGWDGRLPMERYQAARAAGAFKHGSDEDTAIEPEDSADAE